MRSYEKLEVWQKAHELCLAVYRHSNSFPKDETYGLRQQLRSASVSVPSNLVEGCGKSTDAELIRYVGIAMGSVTEVHYQLRLARDLGYMTPEIHAGLTQLATEVRMAGAGFERYLRGRMTGDSKKVEQQSS